MDTRDGRIYPEEIVIGMPAEELKYMKPMALEPTAQQIRAMRVGRNDPCPCGSGQKFKRCCLLRRLSG